MKIVVFLLQELKKYATQIDFEKVKKVAIFCLLFFSVYFFISYFRNDNILPQDVKNAIDSLQNESNNLKRDQKIYDSLIKAENKKIEELDTRISSIKEKTLIVKEYYNQVKQEASSYTPTQVDSFFKERYKY